MLGGIFAVISSHSPSFPQIHVRSRTAGGFWISILQIIAIDILLGGDNAIVIALVCRRLPEQQRRQGIFWGVVGAIGLRVLLLFCPATARHPILKNCRRRPVAVDRGQVAATGGRWGARVDRGQRPSVWGDPNHHHCRRRDEPRQRHCRRCCCQGRFNPGDFRHSCQHSHRCLGQHA